jgi:hypothetical protein
LEPSSSRVTCLTRDLEQLISLMTWIRASKLFRRARIEIWCAFLPRTFANSGEEKPL